jgi:hypothetical protein
MIVAWQFNCQEYAGTMSPSRRDGMISLIRVQLHSHIRTAEPNHTVPTGTARFC